MTWTWNLRAFLDSFLIFHVESDASHVAWISAVSGFGPCLSIPLPPAYFQPCYLASSSWKLPAKWGSSFNSWGFAVSLTPDYFPRFCVHSSPPSTMPLSSGNTELLIRLYIIWNPALPCLPMLFLFSGLSCWLEYPSPPPVAWLIPTPPNTHLFWEIFLNLPSSSQLLAAFLPSLWLDNFFLFLFFKCFYYVLFVSPLCTSIAVVGTK